MPGKNQSRYTNRKPIPREELGPIPSPYNFVPLNEQVFFPDWAEQVSHDIPFQDGISGALELEIEAKTPIYIRAGGVHPEKDLRNQNQAYQRFFEVILPDGSKKFAIPGSSIKGMMRSVVNIASFGKLAALDDHRYGFRDLNNQEYRDHLTEQKGTLTYAAVKTGWLSVAEGGEWQIESCEYSRVGQRDLERHHMDLTGNKMCRVFQGGNRDEQKTAKHKYDLWGGFSLDARYDSRPATSDVLNRRTGRVSCTLAYQLAKIHSGGQFAGRLVFTGQPGPAKVMEFIFRTDTTQPPVPIESHVKKDFTFIHSDANGEANTDWKFWKGKLREGEKVPVFYMTDGEGKVESIGLAQMYRIPFKHRVGACRSSDHKQKDDDLADLLFGYTKDKNLLRGRVQCETAVAVGSPIELPMVQTILNGPKPTYLPNYVEQVHAKNPGNLRGDRYKSYNDDDARLRGFKRYYTRKRDKVRAPAPEAGQQNVITKFRPLGDGSTFRGRVVFHNLRPAELGALLWAIQFGDAPLQAGPSLHQIGMAKPYGYGSVSIRLLPESLRSWRRNDEGTVEEALVQDCLNAYAETMRKFESGWGLAHPRIHGLREMANPQGDRPFPVRYPHLGMRGFDNDFNNHKKAKNILLPPVPECAWSPAGSPPPPKTTAPAPRPAPKPALGQGNPRHLIRNGNTPLDPSTAQVHINHKGMICEGEIMHEKTARGALKVYVPKLGTLSKGSFSKGHENAKPFQPGQKVKVRILGAQENSYSYEFIQ